VTAVVAALALKPLAPFSYNWVGGNIRGLAALAGTLYGYAPKMDAVADALDGQVGQLVNGAGWQGAAASSFKASWSKDSQTSRALGLATDQVGQIVDWLAVSLSMLESELEMAASAAEQHGVTIGANGAPEVFVGPTTSTTEKEAQEWGNWYQQYYTDVMQQAQQARSTAAGALAQTGEQIVAPQTSGTKSAPADAGGPQGMNPGDDITVGDLLGDLVATPAAWSRVAGEKLDDAKTSLSSARDAILKLRKDLGENTVIPDNLLSDLKSNLSSTISDSRALQAADKIDNAVFSVLDTRVSDVTKVVNEGLAKLRGNSDAKTTTVPDPDAGDGADGADGILSKLTDFGKDIPVLDILATAGGTYLGVQGAEAEGQSLDVAIPEQVAANVGSLAAGAFVGGAVGGALAGTEVVSGLAVGGLAVGGAVAAAGGVLAGGIIAVGVGDFATHLFQENWSADIHKDGVVGGVLDGVGHSAAETGQDIANVGKDVGHSVAKVWDSIF
jgi:uncharacterized protein YukE